MFLKSKFFISSLLLLFTMGAQAEFSVRSAFIQAGGYTRVSGPFPQCRSFSLNAKQVASGQIFFSGLPFEIHSDCRNANAIENGCRREYADDTSVGETCIGSVKANAKIIQITV